MGMAGPIGFGDGTSAKSLKKNWRFVLPATVIIAIVVYFWFER